MQIAGIRSALSFMINSDKLRSAGPNKTYISLFPFNLDPRQIQMKRRCLVERMGPRKLGKMHDEKGEGWNCRESDFSTEKQLKANNS